MLLSYLRNIIIDGNNVLTKYICWHQFCCQYQKISFLC